MLNVLFSYCYAECDYECRYAEYHYAECRGALENYGPRGIIF
jgi:hypothetical protein